MKNNYKVLDSGSGKRLELFGDLKMIRPYSQAIWSFSDKKKWESTGFEFHGEMDGGRGRWVRKDHFPADYTCFVGDINFLIKLTDYGHVGFFAEQRENWRWLAKHTRPGGKYLNLFAYTGGSTMAVAGKKGEVTHVDAAKSVVNWARKNSELNNIPAGTCRWIPEDVRKFVSREIRRGNKYDGIILDPPSFGRGPKGETWKIEKHLLPLLKDLKKLLAENYSFFLLTAHTAGFSGEILKNCLQDVFTKVMIESGEMFLAEASGRRLPAGYYARFKK